MERMSIDEAIAHAREVAKNNRKESNYDAFSLDYMNEMHKKNCVKCAEEHEQLAEWLEELKVHHDAKAQGLLIILPCKKGDTIWESDIYLTEFVECEVLRFGFDDAGEIYCIYSAKDKTFHAKRYLREFGKTLFVSKEQAEQALAIMKER